MIDFSDTAYIEIAAEIMIEATPISLLEKISSFLLNSR